jgi:hypothetical protein
MTPDLIKPLIRAAVERSGLTPYAIAKLTDGAISQQHLRRYLDNEADQMTADKLGAVMTVLGLEIRPARRKGTT